MKTLRTLPIFLLLFISSVSAQDFSGYRSGNYTGVNGVFFNPANIADSRYRWDVNLFSISAFAGSDAAEFKFKDYKNNFNTDSLFNQMIGSLKPDNNISAIASVHGPSVMFNVGKKGAAALTTRFRTFVQGKDLDGALAQQILNDRNTGITYPYTINSTNNMVISANVWTEIGASYATTFVDKGKHFFKGGATLKYIGGVANTYINVDNLKGTMDRDAAGNEYLRNTTGGLDIRYGGLYVDPNGSFDLQNALKFKSTGFGGDLGFVYEYRNGSGVDKDENKYRFKLGVSLLDLGSVSYDILPEYSASYKIHINNTDTLRLSSISEGSASDIKNRLNRYPQFFTNAAISGTNYKVNLPSSLHADLDLRLHKGFYIAAAAQLPVSSKSSVANPYYYSYFSVVPRYEGKNLGIYVPATYNELTGLSAGVSLRVGPFFIGSNSLLTALMGTTKQIDVHTGLRFGVLH